MQAKAVEYVDVGCWRVLLRGTFQRPFFGSYGLWSLPNAIFRKSSGKASTIFRISLASDSCNLRGGGFTLSACVRASRLAPVWSSAIHLHKTGMTLALWPSGIGSHRLGLTDTGAGVTTLIDPATEVSLFPAANVALRSGPLCSALARDSAPSPAAIVLGAVLALAVLTVEAEGRTWLAVA